MEFLDRDEAGTLLAQKLIDKKIERPIIIALPRGGVPIAVPIAKALHATLKLAMVRKIGHPGNLEYAIGAVSSTDVLISETGTVKQEFIQEAIKKERKRIDEMTKIFDQKIEEDDIRNNTVIIVDDGIATGQTMRLAVSDIKKYKPTKIIVAVPVCGLTAFNKLSKEADEIISLHTPSYFSGISAYYQDFPQLSDADIIKMISENKKVLKSAKA